MLVVLFALVLGVACGAVLVLAWYLDCRYGRTPRLPTARARRIAVPRATARQRRRQ